MTITDTRIANSIPVLRLPECFDKVFSVLDDRDLHQYSLVSKNAYYQRELFFQLRLEILKRASRESSSPYKVDRLFEKIEMYVYAHFSPDAPSHYAVCRKITDVFRKYDDNRTIFYDIFPDYHNNRTIFSDNVTVSTALHIPAFEAANKAANDHALKRIWPRLKEQLLELQLNMSPYDLKGKSWAEQRMVIVSLNCELDSILPASDAQEETLQSFFNDQSNISLFTNAMDHLASLLLFANAGAKEIRECLNHPTIQILLEWVASADLQSLKLKTAPPEINQLQNLKKIKLDENYLIILPELNQLQNLEYIYLRNNNLMFSQELNQLKNLTYLDLSNNRLITIQDINLLKNLTHLDLSNNRLIALSNLNQLPNLTHLDLSNNRLIALSNLNQLPNLTRLHLSNNKLIALPDDLNQLQNLTHLDLSSNRLIALPDDLNQLQGLTSLYLSNNRFNDITNLHLKELSVLLLGGMKLTEIPSLDHFPKLATLTFIGHASMVISDEVFQKMPHLIQMFFESEIRTRCPCVAARWSLPNESLSYPCETLLALLWQSLNRKGFSIEEIKHIVSNGLTPEDRKLIYKMVWDLDGKVMDGELQWGEHHAFDNGKLFRFALAVQLAILKKLDNLSQEQKNRVYAEIYKLAGSPETRDRQQAEDDAFASLARLADALARREIARRFLKPIDK